MASALWSDRKAIHNGWPPPSKPVLLDVAIPQQSQSTWCWAAVGSGISGYYDDVTYPQCLVVTVVFQVIHAPWTQNCCNDPSGPCNGESNANQALDHPRHHYVSNVPFGTLTALTQQIADGQPVAVQIAWPSGGSHFVAFTGYQMCGPALRRFPLFYIQDPGTNVETWWSGGTYRPPYGGEGAFTGEVLSARTPPLPDTCTQLETRINAIKQNIALLEQLEQSTNDSSVQPIIQKVLGLLGNDLNFAQVRYRLLCEPILDRPTP